MRTATCEGCGRFIYYGKRGGNRGWLHGEPGDSWWECNEGGDAKPKRGSIQSSDQMASTRVKIQMDKARTGRWGNLTPQERFCQKINHHGPIAVNRPELGPCWIWMGARAAGGYPTFYAGVNAPKTHIGAHRFAYEAVIGPIPPGLVLDHFACDNGPGGCVNPHHVRPVTQSENNQRRWDRQRARALDASL